MSEEAEIYIDDGSGGKKTMHKAVSVMHLSAIAFFYVCAGPFGQGEAIAAGGAKWTFIVTLVTPFVFSIPVALISSEQASQMPMCGGCNEWGFILGDFMGHTNVYVRTLCNIFDSAIYPVMTCEYLAGFIPELEWHVGYRSIVIVLVNVIVILLNVSGLGIVGTWSFVITFMIIAPFAIFFCLGASSLRTDLVFADKDPKYGPVDFNLLVSTLIWQYSGWDTVAALAEETKNPKKTFPLGLGITLLMVTLTYILPTVVGLSIQPDLSEWGEAGFGTISELLPYCENKWLSHWINTAGVLSALSLLNSAVSCTGRETYAGGIFGSYPFSNLFARLDKNLKKESAPVFSLVFMSLLTIPFAFFDFELLVEWSGLLTVLQQVFQVAAFIAGRFPKMVDRMIRRRAMEISKAEQVEMSSLDADRDLAIADQEHEKALAAEQAAQVDPNDKFLIPGGWFGVVLVSVPIIACAIFLTVVAGWVAALISIAMLVGMWILKGIDNGIRYLIQRRRRSQARRKREQEVSGSDHVDIDVASSSQHNSHSSGSTKEEAQPEVEVQEEV